MLEIAGVSSVVWQAPVVFLIGIGVGLGLASRFRIVKRPPDPSEKGSSDDDHDV